MVKVGNSELSGRGVFATQVYKSGDVIEVCPVLLLSEEDRVKIDGTELFNYYYAWGGDSSEAAIALGYGSLYNHSYHPNAEYIKDYQKPEIRIIARMSINTNDEITINYNGDPTDTKRLWFEVM